MKGDLGILLILISLLHSSNVTADCDSDYDDCTTSGTTWCSLATSCFEAQFCDYTPNSGTPDTLEPSIRQYVMCPQSYPNVYHDGDYCCKHKKEKVYTPVGAKCDGGVISLTSLCCKDDEYKACSTSVCSDYASTVCDGDDKLNSAFYSGGYFEIAYAVTTVTHTTTYSGTNKKFTGAGNTHYYRSAAADCEEEYYACTDTWCPLDCECYEEQFCAYTPNRDDPDTGEPSIRQYGSSTQVCQGDMLTPSFCYDGFFEIAYAVTTLEYYYEELDSNYNGINSAAMWDDQPAGVYRSTNNQGGNLFSPGTCPDHLANIPFCEKRSGEFSTSCLSSPSYNNEYVCDISTRRLRSFYYDGPILSGNTCRTQCCPGEHPAYAGCVSAYVTDSDGKSKKKYNAINICPGSSTELDICDFPCLVKNLDNAVMNHWVCNKDTQAVMNIITMNPTSYERLCRVYCCEGETPADNGCLEQSPLIYEMTPYTTPMWGGECLSLADEYCYARSLCDFDCQANYPNGCDKTTRKIVGISHPNSCRALCCSGETPDADGCLSGHEYGPIACDEFPDDGDREARTCLADNADYCSVKICDFKCDFKYPYGCADKSATIRLGARPDELGVCRSACCAGETKEMHKCDDSPFARPPLCSEQTQPTEEMQSDLMASCLAACQQSSGCTSDNDERNGCGQMYSCSHACKMRSLGVTEHQCKAQCQPTGHFGCYPTVKDWRFNLCGSCSRQGCNTGYPTVEECEVGCSNYDRSCPAGELPATSQHPGYAAYCSVPVCLDVCNKGFPYLCHRHGQQCRRDCCLRRGYEFKVRGCKKTSCWKETAELLSPTIQLEQCWTRAAVAGRNIEVVKNVDTREECVQLCREETDFTCTSIDYGVVDWNEGVCKLSNETHLNVPENYVQVADYDYCIVGPACWEGMAMSDDVGEDEVTGVPSRKECVDLCVLETDFVCRSITYSDDGVCQLSSKNHYTSPEHYINADLQQYCAIDVDECYKNPCQNGGVCEDGFNEYTCTCQLGFKGKNCEIDALCWVGFAVASNNDKVVRNIATVEDCVQMCNDETSFNCQSVDYGTAGWNDGYCKMSSQNHLHVPQAYGENEDYTYCIVGPVCLEEMSISGYNNSEVLEVESREECLRLCQGETTFPCRSVSYGRPSGSNPGHCVLSSESHWTVPDSYISDSDYDYCVVDIDECETNPCTNEGTCTDGFQTYTCTCLPGFTGQDCEIDIDDCAGNPCANDGTCVDEVGSYSCLCQVGWRGSDCQIDCWEVSEHYTGFTNTTLNGRTCQRWDSQKPHIHNVANVDEDFPGEETVESADNYCRIVDFDISPWCYTTDPNTRWEYCSPKRCSTTTDGWICWEDMSIEGFVDKEVVSVDTEETCVEMCQNETDFACRSVNYAPVAIGSEVSEGDCILSRENHLTVPTAYNASEHYTYCFVDINDCTVDTCQNGGECMDNLMMNYTCICQPGFEGVNCEININECMSNPCQNGGVCTDDINNYLCECVGGYLGQNCEIFSYCWESTSMSEYDVMEMHGVHSRDHCVQLCHDETSFDCFSMTYGKGLDNNGICKLYNESHLTAPGSYEENADLADYCIVGPVCWTGMRMADHAKQVAISSSISEKAQHEECAEMCNTETEFKCRSVNVRNGICEMNAQNHLSSPGSYNEDEHYDYCIVDIDECSMNPCQNGATCEDGFNSYTCHCRSGYRGKNCQNKLWRTDKRCQNLGVSHGPRRRNTGGRGSRGRGRVSKVDWKLHDGVTPAQCNPRSPDHCCNRWGWCSRHYCAHPLSIIYE